MAIYKLSDISSFTRGNSNFQKKDLLNVGEYMALHYGKTYKQDIIDNSFNYFVNKEFFKKNMEIRKGDLFLISTSETVSDLGKVVYYNSDIPGLLGGEQIKLDPVTSLVNPKYLYYWLSKNQNIWAQFATGLSVFRFKGTDFEQITIDLPNLEIQKKIIDIIEPVEKVIHNASEQIKILKQSLILKYKTSSSVKVPMSQIVKLVSEKYRGQKEYFATNAFGEFSINLESKQFIDLKSVPSRANLTPEANSIIVSKLDGENKIFYFDKRPEYVVSTGFFNIKTDYTDHLLGFLLSEDFTNQKSMNSTGTTMRGLNNPSLLGIEVFWTENRSYEITKTISKLVEIESNLKEAKSKLINLLIK